MGTPLTYGCYKIIISPDQKWMWIQDIDYNIIYERRSVDAIFMKQWGDIAYKYLHDMGVTAS